MLLSSNDLPMSMVLAPSLTTKVSEGTWLATADKAA